jgi:hypothetical protein
VVRFVIPEYAGWSLVKIAARIYAQRTHKMGDRPGGSGFRVPWIELILGSHAIYITAFSHICYIYGMTLASQIAGYRNKGFTTEQAEVIALMRVAAGVLFQDFPDSFLLFGGAALLLFHQSVRHSGDLDLLARVEERPNPDEIQASLAAGLSSAAEALNFAPLRFENVSQGNLGTKLWIAAGDGRRLFRVDLNRFGSVLQSEIEEHAVDIDSEHIASVKSASRDCLLLQKAECFLLRRIVKTRDAFDVRLLKESGGTLDDNLKSSLTDTLMSWEIEAEDIVKRIEQVNVQRCTAELRPVLPADVFETLAKDGFKPLRDALCELYADWL